jgi:ribonuclease P protein component
MRPIRSGFHRSGDGASDSCGNDRSGTRRGFGFQPQELGPVRGSAKGNIGRKLAASALPTLTWMGAVSTLCRLDARRGCDDHEADIPAQPAAAQEDPRLPAADEDQGWPQRAQAPPGKGPEATHGLSRGRSRRTGGGREPPQGLGRADRLRSAGAIQQVFRRGHRIERGSFIALWTHARQVSGVAFAASRRTGGAVTRNRARRRVREAYRRQEGRVPADMAVVFVARPRAASVDFMEILTDMKSAVAIIRRQEAGGLRPRGDWPRLP